MSGKRGQGEGSFSKRADGRWMGRVQLDGRRHAVYGRTKAEARDKLAEVVRRVQADEPPRDSRMTLSEWLDVWERDLLPSGRRKASTVDTYRRVAWVHVRPRLGGRTLADLKPSHVAGMLHDIERAGKGVQLRRTALTVTRLALDGAVRDGVIARNAAEKVDRPQAHDADRREAHWWSPEEVRALLDVDTDERLHPLWVTIASTGLRRGEALALRWEDVELDGLTLSVRGTVSRVDGQGLVVTSPKSRRSRRTLPIPEYLANLLREQRTTLKRERLAAGGAWRNEGWVFPNELGGLLEPRNVSRWFGQRVKAAGLTGSLHTLRHSAASTLVANGVPMRVVAEVLGHSNTRLTADTYAHVAQAVTADALAVNAKALGFK